MTAATSTYRWNTSAAAEAYDAAAPVIHPYYVTVQDQILDSLPFGPDRSRLCSWIWAAVRGGWRSACWSDSRARVTVVDQSEPFLALAERRLGDSRRGRRSSSAGCRTIGRSKLQAAPNAIVSTSAIHHLEPQEKRALYARCFAALAPGGMFINGDEYRPADDGEYLALFKEWSAHMNAAIADGRIPESFHATLDHWHDRNIRRFGEPKKSGDDCQETIETQIGYLREAGFASVELAWAAKLWAVMVAEKPAA